MKNCITRLLVFLSAFAYAFSQDESIGLRWSSGFSERGFNFVNDMVVDNDGNVYVAGSTGDESNTETHNMLIGKFNFKGELLWKDTLQGAADKHDVAYDIAIDKSGDIYVAGGSQDSMPIQWGSIILVKYNPSGERLWRKVYGGTATHGTDYGYVKIDFDAVGNLYLNTNSISYPGAQASSLATAKFTPAGTLLWEKSLAKNYAKAMTVDAEGNTYITGWDDTYYKRVTTAKYDSEGNLKWQQISPETQLHSDFGYDIATDKAGNTYVLGERKDDVSPRQMILMKYDISGTLQWTKSKVGDVPSGLQRSGNSGGLITTDNEGNIYTLTSEYNNTTSEDIVLTKFNPLGDELWVAKYNGAQNSTDIGYKLAMDTQGDLYITGKGYSASAFYYDIISLKYNSAGELLWVKNQPLDLVGYIIYPAPSGDVYVAGHSHSNSSGGGSIQVLKYSPSTAAVEKPVTQSGTYVFNASGNNTAITITFNTVSGTGTVDVSYFGFPAVNVEFDGSKPINISQYKWVIDALGITGIDAELKIALDMLQNSGGIIDPNDVKIFKREIEGSGAFKELTTKFENGELKASITEFSEFILGSNSSPLLVEEEGGTIPETAVLLQSFPEPFKSSTKIRFALPQQAHVTLKVHDSFGKEIALVVNEQLGAGNYYYQFNAENLPPGVYFYTLSAGRFTETKKMILIK